MICWTLLITNTRHAFLNIRTADPMALAHTLFPTYWILLLAFFSLCIAVIVLRIESKWVHLLLLMQISLMLYYTPFLISGFSQNPDTLWHAATGISISDVLSGKELFLSDYGAAYPLSFVCTCVLVNLTGASIFDFTLYIYPIFGAVITALLSYVLALKFLCGRDAFVSMLFALPALHYLQLNVSPRMSGFLLTMTAMILICRFERKSTALALALTLALILTHPTSPLILAAFLLAVFVSRLIARRSQNPPITNSLLFIVVGALCWALYFAALVWQPIAGGFSRILNLQFLKGLEYATEFTTFGGGFIYREISFLNQLVYLGLILLALAPFIVTACRRRFSRSMPRIETKYNVSEQKLIPIIYTFLLIPMIYGISLITTQSYDQFQRALAFLIIMVSISIGSHSFLSRNAKSKSMKIALTLWLALIFLSYPIISYSKEAYNTFPPSEGEGMKFIASNIILDNRNLSMYAKQQLAAYISSIENLSIVKFPPDLNENSPYMVVLRSTAFYNLAMRRDRSFEDNRFIQLQNKINKNVLYDRVYSNPTFDIYVKAN